MTQDQFIADYGEFIYKASYKCYLKLKGRPYGEEETDLICDVAVKIMETFSTKIEEGTMNFRGESEFSTFIFGAVYNQMRERLFGKKYYPASLKPYGDAGRCIYNLRYINHYPRKEALELVRQETGLSAGEIDKIDMEIASSLKTSVVQNKGSSKTEITENQLDDFISSICFSHGETPELQLLRSELRVKIISILKNLKPDLSEIIILRFIEGQDTERIQKQLGFKNGQAVHNLLHKARKAFIREAERQELDRWIDLSFKGAGHERRALSR